MSNDYLWDGAGPPDPDVEKLEKMLEPMRHKGPAPDFPMPVRQMPRRPWMRRLVPLAAAAALVLMAWAAWEWQWGTPTLTVERLSGAPVVGSKPIGRIGEIGIGQWLVTDAASRARIDVALIGEVEVQPNSRVGLLHTGAKEHRLSLERGKMRARIWAPPLLFFVETPSSTAIDLGCAYTLEVDDAGAGELLVESGWVAFEYKGRESFVPAGAMCRTRPGVGPGTPVRKDASAAMKNALQTVDFELPGVAGGVPGGVSGGVQGGVAGGVQGGVADGVEGGIEGPMQRRAAAIGTVLEESRAEDAFTLWHLLARTQGDERARVYDRLAQFVPPPDGVTREGVLRGDRPMLDAWWNALGLKSSSWWRMWKGPWPPPAK